MVQRLGLASRYLIRITQNNNKKDILMDVFLCGSGN